MLDGPKKFTFSNYLLSDEEKEQLRLVLLNNVDFFFHLEPFRYGRD